MWAYRVTRTHTRSLSITHSPRLSHCSFKLFCLSSSLSHAQFSGFYTQWRNPVLWHSINYSNLIYGSAISYLLIQRRFSGTPVVDSKEAPINQIKSNHRQWSYHIRRLAAVTEQDGRKLLPNEDNHKFYGAFMGEAWASRCWSHGSIW